MRVWSEGELPPRLVGYEKTHTHSLHKQNIQHLFKPTVTYVEGRQTCASSVLQ